MGDIVHNTLNPIKILYQQMHYSLTHAPGNILTLSIAISLNGDLPRCAKITIYELNNISFTLKQKLYKFVIFVITVGK